MGKQLIATRPARAELRAKYFAKHERGHSQGTKADGTREGEVQIFVDLDRMVQLYGLRALTNRTGRATAMNGCVEIVVKRGTVKDHRLPRAKYAVPVLHNGKAIDSITVTETSPEDARTAASVEFYDRGYTEKTGHALGRAIAEET